MRVPFRSLWLVEGMGLTFEQAMRWKDNTLFRKFPQQCEICGWEWRPDRRDKFIDVWGDIVKVKYGYRWVNYQLCLVRNTGHIEPHPRKICIYHKTNDDSVVDCFTGVQVTLLPYSDKRKEWKNDIKFWLGCTFRFLKALARYGKELLLCAS